MDKFPVIKMKRFKIIKATKISSNKVTVAIQDIFNIVEVQGY